MYTCVAMDGQLLTAIPKVNLIRMDSRQGLIRGRIRGSEAAVGPALLFLDSHCEVTKGWLEPLLSRIKKVENHTLTRRLWVWGAVSYTHLTLPTNREV